MMKEISARPRLTSRPRNASLKHSLVVLAVVLSALAAISLVFLCAHWLAVYLADQESSLKPSERVTAIASTRTTLAQLVAAAGIAGGLIFTARAYVLNRRTHHA